MSLVNNDKAGLGPPVLTQIPVTAKGKVKHHKVQHEVPLDMTVMNLFKPNGLINDALQNNVFMQGGKSTLTSRQSQYPNDVYKSFVKPENHQVLTENLLFKSSPVILEQDGQRSSSTSTSMGMDDEIKNISHKQSRGSRKVMKRKKRKSNEPED